MRFGAHFIRSSTTRRLDWRSGLAVCLLQAWLCGVVAAQYRPYRFDHWTTDNGLPQNTIRSLVQTRDGYVWLTTFDGLVRFDGVRFTVFDQSNTPALVSNRFTQIAEDKDGTLYAATEEGPLTVYRRGVFTSYTPANGLPGPGAGLLTPDRHGELLIRFEGRAVYLRDGKFIPAPPESQPNQQRNFYLGPSGRLWVVDQQGVKLDQDGKLIHYPFAFESLNMDFQVKLYEDRAGSLWVGSVSGLYRVRDGVVTHYTEKDGLPPRAFIRPYAEDPDGGIWFIFGGVRTTENRLARFKDGRFTFFDAESGLPQTDIGAIISDREGAIWIGASTGLYRARKQLITAYSTGQGLLGKEVYPLLETRSGDILIGTMEGLSRFRAGRSIQQLPPLFGLTLAQALWEDPRGRLWVGHIGGLHWYENGKSKKASATALGTTYAIRPDRQGQVWVGGGDGLFKFNHDQITAHYTTKNGLPNNQVKVIHEARDGALWLGTYGGLARLKDGQFTYWTTKDGLGSDNVRALKEDADGTFWIGTYDGGLSRWRDGRFFNYTIDNGLFNNGVFAMLEDRRHNFWISCNKGIYRVNRAELNDLAEGKIPRLNCIVYGKQDGMLSTECNGGRQPAGLIAADGKLWFPTQDGVAVIDPEAITANPLPPPVEIEAVTIDPHPVAFASSVQVQPSQTSLDITYTALSLSKSELIRFKYKLEGLNDDWIEAGARRTAYYSYLPPGQYTFRVSAANADGLWNTEGRALKVIVIPPVYRTWWFIVLVAVSVLGAAFGVYQYRVAQLRKRHATREAFSQQLLASQEAFAQQLIESQEQERQRIAAELHDSLGQNLLIIKNRAALVSLNSKDVAEAQQQFNDITASTTHALEEVRQIAYNLRPYHLDNLGLTNSLEAMIDKVESSSGIRFSYDIAPLNNALPKDGEINFYRVVQEALNNIVKHSQATRARVQVVRDEQIVYLTISDNGQGFNVQATTEANGRRGFGLTGMVERVRMLGGTHSIDSAPGQGTTVTVEVALQRIATG
jgi:signal transduction histidine kinase/ligand-binding sensor domain-containing protein